MRASLVLPLSLGAGRSYGALDTVMAPALLFQW